jgi:hypothetical protein
LASPKGVLVLVVLISLQAEQVLAADKAYPYAYEPTVVTAAVQVTPDKATVVGEAEVPAVIVI